MIYDLQLQWIHDLHQHLRSSYVDAFFIAWNYVDTGYFTFIAIVLIWYLWDKKIGVRLLYILVLSLAINQSLKVLFHLPRPCQVDPAVGIICHASFGFPSGAAQTAAILGGVIVLESKRMMYRSLGVLFAVLLCFSRVYLGMHYPTDILGGLAVGSVLLFIYYKIFPLFTKHWQLASVCFPFFLLIPVHYLSWDIFWFYSILGIACGLMTETKTNQRQVHIKIGVRIAQFFIVLGGVCALFVLDRYMPHVQILWNFCAGYWLSFLGAYLALKLFMN